MAKVPARCWPHDLPFSGIRDHKTGKPLEWRGFVCDERPGDFKFIDDERNGITDPAHVEAMAFRCPRTGKHCGRIIVGHQVKPDRPGGATWKWDGNLEKPTLEPSINCTGGCGWHGYLRGGVWED